MSSWIKYSYDDFDIYENGVDASTEPSYKGTGDFWSGVSNWWKKVTGNGLTDSALQANSFESSEAQKNRDFQSYEADINRRFQAQQAEAAYNRQVDFYNTYQSPSAMVQQYKDAGLNPALLSGGISPSSPPSQSVPSGSMPSGSQASARLDSGDPGSVLSFIMNLLGFRSHINKVNAETGRIQAETGKINKETSWIDTYNTASVDSLKAGIEQVKSNISVNEQQVQESLQRVKESLKRMDVMQSQIEVNGALVDLHGSQQVLNESRSAVEKLNAKQIEMLLPYIQARQEAEIALTNAKTSEALNSAESLMYDANLKMLKSLVEAKLIDSSYYDSVIDQAHWDVKYKKREYKWKPINDICHNISMLAIGAGSVLSGGASVVSATGKNASEGLKDVATLNFF